MAVLSDQDRADLCVQISREVSDLRELFPLSKAEFRAAVDAIDAWVDANAASFNATLPLPARTALTAQLKARLFMSVVRQRFVRA
jgi:hypothetical protein